MEKKFLDGKLELRFAGVDAQTDSKSFAGYGAYFANIDAYGDVIAPGAFSKSIAAHASAGTTPLMLFNHQALEMPIGVWTSLSEDERGLKVEGDLIDTTTGRDAYVALKAGAITGLSIGFRCTGYEMDGNSRTITEAELHEISVVTFPANDLARVSAVKMEKSMTDQDLTTILSDAGFDEEAVNALFASRDEDADEETEAEKTEYDTGEVNEAKYDQAAMTAAIKSIVATTKEMYVR